MLRQLSFCSVSVFDRESKINIEGRYLKQSVSAERADAERRAKLSPKYLAARAGSDPPPILGEPDSPVRAPLKPKPHLRSGVIALLEPEPEDAFA
jgi:hypothetical protein